MNVLVLSAAAKVLLVRAFAEACHARGGRVFAADLGPDNAALFEADRAVILPRSDAPDFTDTLLQFCRENRIGLLVPTRDSELAVLAAAKARFAEAGVAVLAPDPEALEVCQDKRRFVEFCAARGLATPRTYAIGEHPPGFPVFARPVRGAGGKGAGRVETLDDLPDGHDVLVQDLVTAPEYSIDVLLDLSGRPLQAVARQRLVVRDGEAVKSRTEALPDLVAQSLALCGALGLVGHNVVQAFHSSETGVQFIEINPRFGGASNLSIQAGLASPHRILQMLAGEDAEAARERPIVHGLTMLRHAEDRFVTEADLAAVLER